MLINEVCKLTGLTKKAISYYEKHGLISPGKDNSGYREYSNNDIALLNEISLYRKLDIPIKDIKIIIKTENKKAVINKIIREKEKKEMQIKMQKIYLEKVIHNNFNEESIKQLNEEIIQNEKNNGEFIKRELIRAFPSGIGRYLAYHFAPYLNESIDTVEKYRAWVEIVDFLDDVPELKIPKIIEKGYENITDEMIKQINEGTKNEIEKMINAEGEELEKYKEELLSMIDKQNNQSFLKKMNPIFKFKKQLNEFFNSSGYYSIFIPNIKILSRDYKEYHDSLMKLNDKLSKELGIKYDENMNLIKLD